MKKIRLVFTLVAIMLAGVGVFATTHSTVTVDPRIDSDQAGIDCDEPVSTECNVINGQDCRYNDGGTLVTVHDFASACQQLDKAR
jgi:hypothetical protein